jgi:hypothetical protein
MLIFSEKATGNRFSKDLDRMQRRRRNAREWKAALKRNVEEEERNDDPETKRRKQLMRDLRETRKAGHQFVMRRIRKPTIQTTLFPMKRRALYIPVPAPQPLTEQDEIDQRHPMHVLPRGHLDRLEPHARLWVPCHRCAALMRTTEVEMLLPVFPSGYAPFHGPCYQEHLTARPLRTVNMAGR